MSFLLELEKKRADKRHLSEKQHDEYLLSISNDETSADELRIVLKFVILPIFFIWVAYVGYIHLSKELVGVVPEQHIFWLAAGIPLLFQFIKAYCATKCLRAFHFKWYDKSAYDFWLYRMLGVLTVFAFIWTLKISFWDIKNTVEANYVERNTATLESHLKAATLDIDTKIEQQKQKEASLGSIVNGGRINWAKQPIAAENAKSSSALDAQRAEIVTAATKEFEKRAGTIEKQSKTRGNFFQRFGGFGEVGEIICFILIGLLEAKLRNINRNTHNKISTPSPSLTTNQQFNGHGGGKNGGVQQRYYFTRSSPQGDVITAYEHDLSESQPEKSVSQAPLIVTQTFGEEDGDHADDVLLLAMKRLKGHDDNFDRKHGKNETTAQNIHDILDGVLFKMKGTFRPSADVHAKFSTYVIETLFPLLWKKKFRYPKQIQFEGWLRTVAPIPA